MSKASKFIKNMLKSSTTLPMGSGGGPVMGSMFSSGHSHHDHHHHADGSCCNHDHSHEENADGTKPKGN